MGRAKHWMEAVGGNYGAVADKYVSPACFGDEHLRDAVASIAEPMRCSYTGKRPAAPLTDVVELISDALRRHYDDVQNTGLGYDSEDDTYFGRTWETDELVQEYVLMADNVPWELTEDITAGLGHFLWSENDPYGAKENDILNWSWDRFVDVVRHKRRYFFHDHGTDDQEHINPATLLSSLANGCNTAGLFRTLQPGEIFWRCRSRKRGERYPSPREMGPPPAENAKQNRMSPAGIPMFYGALKKQTAKSETPPYEGFCAVAQFKLLKEIVVLDLTDVPEISIFDERRADIYHWSIFMKQFLQDFSKPVQQDDHIHIDYVPTQIVTEYFRSVAKPDGKQLNGVMYRSARDRNGICCVLFADRMDVLSDDEELSESQRLRGPFAQKESGGPLLERISLRYEKFEPQVADELLRLLKDPTFVDA
jgi:hypothetical protein